MRQENSTTLSIVIPVFNEITYLNKLFQQIKKFFNEKQCLQREGDLLGNATHNLMTYSLTSQPFSNA